MSSTHAQIQFSAEFLTLMVAAAGLALALLRPDPRGPAARRLAILGFLVAGTVAFLRGSLLLTNNTGGGLSIGRLVGAGLLAAAIPGWSGGRRIGYLLWTGVAGWVAAAVAELDRPSSITVDVLLAIGSLAIGIALLAATRHSISVRVAASAATTLLLVVLVLAIALSAVISSSLQHDELNRLSSRANTESGQIESTITANKQDVALIVTDLAATNPGALSTFDRTVISGRLADLQRYSQIGGAAYAARNGDLALSSPQIQPIAHVLAQLLSLHGVPTLACGDNVGSAFVYAGSAWIYAADSVCSRGTNEVLGTVLAVTPLNDAFLAGRRAIDPTVSLALVSGPRVVAGSGHLPSIQTVTSMGARSTGTAATTNDFLAVVPVSVAHGSPPLSLVLTSPGTTVFSTRDQLYRTLFLIALGGTVLALGVSAFTGDRITARIRRLTTVASRIEGGNRSDRAGIPGEDEVARLGSAFDSMVDSVEDHAAALRSAADDETRLRNRLEAVVAGMTDALVAVDAHGLITDFNIAAEQLFGVTVGAAQGRRVDRVIRLVEETGKSLDKPLLDSGAEPWGMLAWVPQAENDPVPVAVSSGVLRGPVGELAGRVFVLRDLRRELEIEQMKTEFLSRVGHELRTPLTGIMGYADILLRRDVSADRAREWHEEILLSGRRLLRIVEMLEFFASSGAGRVRLRPEPIDTRALVNGLTSAWSERLPEHLKITRRVARNTPNLVADRRWLTMAIDELIDNAVKFSPDAGRILVAASPVNQHGNGKRSRADSVEISVSDRGVGMSPDSYADAFSDFVQVDGSDTRRFGGLGLGLAVVRRVVESHGGEVSCRPATGRGTTFTIVLPAATNGLPTSPTQIGRRS